MEKVEGTPVAPEMLENFRRVRDLIYFDGAFLSQFQNEAGENFFYVWCDCDRNYNRWLIIKVNEMRINRYLEGEITLYDVVADDSVKAVLLADFDNDSKLASLVALAAANLPDLYVPETDSFYASAALTKKSF